MRIILTKKEYDDLIKRATASELTAEERLGELKKQLRDRIATLAKDYIKREPDCVNNYRLNQFFTQLFETLSHY